LKPLLEQLVLEGALSLVGAANGDLAAAKKMVAGMNELNKVARNTPGGCCTTLNWTPSFGPTSALNWSRSRRLPEKAFRQKNLETQKSNHL